jgi:tetratricopeptide (TPR) repeat protein
MWRARTLLALGEVSLVRHDPFEDGTPAITVHRLVQAMARARAAANGTAPQAAARLVARLTAIYPSDGYNNPACWPLCAQLTPHLVAGCDIEEAAASQVEMLGRAGTYFLRADYAQAEYFFRQALAIRGKATGPEHPFAAILLGNLANLLQLQGDFARAQPLCERVLTMLVRDRDNFATARPLYERALIILEQALGSEHPDAKRVRNGYARLLLAAERPAETAALAETAAVALAEAALAAHDATFGASHPWTKDTVRIAAAALAALGRSAEAETLRARYGLGAAG